MKNNSFADILSALDAQRQKRIARKLPSWQELSRARVAAGLSPMRFPSELALQQCSSEKTAAYKAALVGSLFLGELALRPLTAVDLCTGLGVDSAAISSLCSSLVCYEADSGLADALRHNFEALGIIDPGPVHGQEGLIAGITPDFDSAFRPALSCEIRCEAVGPATDIPAADLIFADPARRGRGGKKVFLLEDCSPNVPEMLPMLLGRCRVLLLKLSPMADIAMLRERLGEALEQVHVVGAEGEVKEILCVLRGRGEVGGEASTVSVIVSPEADFGDGSFSFTPEEEAAAGCSYSGRPEPGDVLLEPGPALLKSGAFKLPCRRSGLLKLAPSTHLYICPRGYSTDLPAGLFKPCRILEVHPFNSDSLRELGRRFPLAEVSARNLPLSSEALRSRMRVRDGSAARIIGCSTTDSRILIVAERIQEFK